MINLLPPKFKEELRQEENWKIISILGIIFLIFLISQTLILLTIKIYSLGQIESQKILVDLEEKTAKTSELQPLLEKINSANQNISKLFSFYQKETRPTEILEKISQILPPQIYFNTFSWQKANSQIIISGFASSRDTLFQFKKNLEEKKEFKEIDFPPQSWIKSTDINFNINFKYEP